MTGVLSGVGGAELCGEEEGKEGEGAPTGGSEQADFRVRHGRAVERAWRRADKRARLVRESMRAGPCWAAGCWAEGKKVGRGRWAGQAGLGWFGFLVFLPLFFFKPTQI